jgi:chorismate mutase
MRLRALGIALTLLVGSAFAAQAQRVHVLIISGLAGEPQYRARFLDAAATLADTARTRWGVADSSLIVLGEDPAQDPKHIKAKATKEEVAQAFMTLSHRVAPGDIVLVFLNGHGAGEGPLSRVNLPGPDPTAADFATWISGFTRQTVVFVNAASGSGDFVPVLAGRGRLVVSATKTAIERNETVFAKPFIKALTTGEADADKDGRVSVYEAFDYAKKEVGRLYEVDNKMLTEHAVLSDTAMARTVAFGGKIGSSDPRVIALVAERQELESQVAALRARKATTDPATYERELERLLLLVAEKTQAIRAVGSKP